MIEGVYNRTWYIKKEGGLEECKEGSGKIWRKNKYRSKKTRKVRNNKGKRL